MIMKLRRQELRRWRLLTVARCDSQLTTMSLWICNCAYFTVGIRGISVRLLHRGDYEYFGSHQD
jgi:hypothetical protein